MTFFLLNAKLINTFYGSSSHFGGRYHFEPLIYGVLQIFYQIQ